jgi:hypothetical protein
MLRQERNVLRTLAQPRNMDGENIQSIVEVAAKLFLQDHSFQVAMSRGHNPHVDFLRPRASQALKFPLLQDTKKLRLQLERDVANFIQEERALICKLEPADLLCDRTGERSPLMPKQFALEQPGRDGGAVELDKWSVDGTCRSKCDSKGLDTAIRERLSITRMS